MVRINLLPVRVSKKKEAGKQQLVLFVAVLLLGVVVNWVIHDRWTSALASVESRVKKAKTDIATLDKIIGQVKEITSQQEQLKKKLETLDKLKAGRSGPVRMMDELSGITPRRLWLKKMEERGGKMTFQGSALNIDDVSQFIGALKGSTYFTEVELKKTEARGDSKVQDGPRTVEFTIFAVCKYTAATPSADDGAAKSAPRKG